MAELHR